MKKTIRILVLLMALGISNANAQKFQGIATYKTQRTIDLKLDSTKNTNITNDFKKQMSEMLKKQFQKTFKLTFDKSTSVYNEEQNLDAPKIGGSSAGISFIGNGSSDDVLYKNTKNNKYTEQKDLMSKIFLIKDEIKPIEWKFEKETKFIGQYECRKATYIKMVPKPMNLTEYSKYKKDDKEIEKVEQIVTAWYTLQIPVNNGPAMYQGLPGLILQVNDGNLNIVCSQIVLNPKQKVTIKQPQKGKEINEKAFNKIREEKQKEMLKRLAPRKGNRNDNSFNMIIGG